MRSVAIYVTAAHSATINGRRKDETMKVFTRQELHSILKSCQLEESALVLDVAKITAIINEQIAAAQAGKAAA